MTVPATARRAGPFSGNGVTTSFPFTFKVFSAADVAVVLADSNGLETELVLGSGYSVTLNSDQDASPGGAVIYPLVGTPLPAGSTLTVRGAIPYDQTLDLPSGGAFSPRALENALDRTVIQVQQLAEETARGLKLPVSSTADPVLPAPESNKVIGWNDSASGLVNRDITDLASAIAYGTNTTQLFSGDGTATQFTLAADPGSVHNLDVSISGVVQSAVKDFTLSGLVLTFLSAPPAGTDNIAARYGQALPVGTADSADVTFLPAGIGATTRSVRSKLHEFVSVLDFGAVGDGITDDTAAIQAAIDYVASSGGGSVDAPQGVYLVSQVILKSYVSLIGSRAENGWARLLTYRNGSVIKSLGGSGLSPVKLAPGANNWGLQNLVVDANKANQTHPGVHCVEHLRTAAGDSFGGLIDGCKFVNPTGYGLYLMRCRPLDIRDSFVMSGAAFIQCYDVNIGGCSIDGTDSKHPSVLWDSCNSVQALNNLIWRGESASSRTRQAATVDTVNDWLVVTDDTQFYDNQPVTIESSGAMPTMTLSGSAAPVGWTHPFLVKKLGANKIQLWRTNTDPSTGHAVLFSTAGSSVFLTSGARDIFCTYEGFNQKIAGNRIAGSPGGAFRSHRCTMVSYENNDSYLLNFDDSADQDGVTIIGGQYHLVTNSFVGDLDQEPSLTRLLSAVRILDDTSTSPTIVSKGNVIGPNQYNVTQGLYVADASTAAYEERNIIVGLEGLFGGAASGVNRVSSATHRSEPLRYYYSAVPTSAQSINASTATDIAWTAAPRGNPSGITDGVSITFPLTSNSLIEVTGSIGLNRLAGVYYVLVYVVVNGTPHRFYSEQEVSKTDPGLIVVPFSVTVPVVTNAVVTVQVFQTSAGAMTLQTSAATSRLTVRKVSDCLF